MKGLTINELKERNFPTDKKAAIYDNKIARYLKLNNSTGKLNKIFHKEQAPFYTLNRATDIFNIIRKKYHINSTDELFERFVFVLPGTIKCPAEPKTLEIKEIIEPDELSNLSVYRLDNNLTVLDIKGKFKENEEVKFYPAGSILDYKKINKKHIHGFDSYGLIFKIN